MAEEGLTLDSGALIAFEKGDRAVWALIKLANDEEATITVPATVLAQVWRGSNLARIAKLLQGCVVESFDGKMAREVGRLLGMSNTSDVVDGSVVEGVLRRGDAVLTSDPDDIERLVEVAGKKVGKDVQVVAV